MTGRPHVLDTPSTQPDVFAGFEAVRVPRSYTTVAAYLASAGASCVLVHVYNHDTIVGRADRFHLPNDGGRAIWTYEYDDRCPMQHFISRRVRR